MQQLLVIHTECIKILIQIQIQTQLQILIYSYKCRYKYGYKYWKNIQIQIHNNMLMLMRWQSDYMQQHLVIHTGCLTHWQEHSVNTQMGYSSYMSQRANANTNQQGGGVGYLGQISTRNTRGCGLLGPMLHQYPDEMGNGMGWDGKCIQDIVPIVWWSGMTAWGLKYCA